MNPVVSAPALLIAVTGSAGEGRTALLAGLAAEFRAAGQQTEGVLAVAEDRAAGADTGAPRYRLHILGEPDDLPWAEREAEPGAAGPTPYTFDAATHRRLRLWADGLRTRPPAALLVLDEFGKLEAQGGGLMPLWPTVAAAAPAIAVLSVREHVVEEIERRLGRRFDLRIAAGDPDAAARLRRACADFGEWTRLGLWGGASGGVEMSLGTLLHSTGVPLRGLALCGLQAAMLTFASAGLSQAGRVIWVAFVSAGLKALSPGGGRVRPMVAICAQGTLFAASVQLLGWNALGAGLGGALAGTWAALQGFLLQYLLLGEELVNTYAQLAAWLQAHWQVEAPTLSAAIVGWALLHAAAAAACAVTARRWRAPPRALQNLIDRELAALTPPPSAVPVSRVRRLAREFGRWQFWLPLALVALVLLGSGRGWDAVAWLALRFVAVGLVLFAVLSLFRPAQLAETLRRHGWWGPATAFSGAWRRKT